jgi:hypothetical protein
MALEVDGNGLEVREIVESRVMGNPLRMDESTARDHRESVRGGEERRQDVSLSTEVLGYDGMCSVVSKAYLPFLISRAAILGSLPRPSGSSPK